MKKDRRIALVTGGNRGIGFEVCRQLSAQGFHVLMGARNLNAGKEAAAKLARENVEVEVLELDVADEQSIERAGRTVEERFQRLDVLVNNAGILLDPDTSALDARLAPVRQTMETNVYGPILLCQTFIPLMRRNGYGRIVNISSGMGQLSEMGGGYLAYRLSKTALNAVTRIFAAEAGKEVLVNSMCPGWVRTEMGGSSAPRTPAQGADTVVWLATLPAGGPTGGLFEDREAVSW